MLRTESYQICPLDKSHSILSSKIQIHLYKCRKNHPGEKVTCPYNQTHLLDPMKYEHHVATCPSSGSIRRYEVVFEGPESVGTVSLEEACSISAAVDTQDNDDWNGNYPSYNPEIQAQNENIFRVQIGLSKAKKREFRQSERDRLNKLEQQEQAGPGTCGSQGPRDVPVRGPKDVPKKSMVNKNNLQKERQEQVGPSTSRSQRPGDIPVRGSKDVPKRSMVNNNLQEKSTNKPASEPKNITKLINLPRGEDFTDQLIRKLRNITVQNEKGALNENTIVTQENDLKSGTSNADNVSAKAVSTAKTNDALTYAEASSATKHWKKFDLPVPRKPYSNFGEPGRVCFGRGFRLDLRPNTENAAETRDNGDDKEEEVKATGSHRGYDEESVDKN